VCQTVKIDYDAVTAASDEIVDLLNKKKLTRFEGILALDTVKWHIQVIMMKDLVDGKSPPGGIYG